MIIVELLNPNEDEFGLIISGHAGFLKKGSDIICSAVSGMAQMIEVGLKMLSLSHEMVKDDGEIKINPLKNKEIAFLIKSFYISCKKLETEYSKYIKTKEKINGT